MRIGDTELWLDGSGRRQNDDERLNWIGICVDDVDAVYRRVQDAGIECEAPVDRDFGVRMLNVPGEMGYLWGFIRRTWGWLLAGSRVWLRFTTRSAIEKLPVGRGDNPGGEFRATAEGCSPPTAPTSRIPVQDE